MTEVMIMQMNNTTKKPLNQNDMKKTALQWFIEQLEFDESMSKEDIQPVIDKALEIEKQQIKEAWLNSLTKGEYNSAEDYYNETYKSE